MEVPMATMNVSLPDPMKDWVEGQTKSGRYSNASDYVRDLIRRDKDRQTAVAELQRLVDEGLASGPCSEASIWKRSWRASGRNMPPSPSKEYRLSPAAQSDLSGIWDYTAEMWSPDQATPTCAALAKSSKSLCSHPEIARERTEIDPPVRLHPYRSHLIIYRIADDHLAIIRVVHNRQHWQALLNDADDN